MDFNPLVPILMTVFTGLSINFKEWVPFYVDTIKSADFPMIDNLIVLSYRKIISYKEKKIILVGKEGGRLEFDL